MDKKNWLPNDYVRCIGHVKNTNYGPALRGDCVDCLRRTAPVTSPYTTMAVLPKKTPCPLRIAP